MKIRSDLEGVVFISGVQYTAGDEVPEGAAISSALLEPVAPSSKGRSASKGASSRSKGE